ncbi:MAG: rplW [Parcubacteria group bacterium]|nr:rplW [Parcubacteria group bacterium]
MADTTVQKKIERKSVLLSPRSTEKAALLQNRKNIYVFNVSKDATKKAILACLKAEYKVVPEKIRMAAVHAKPTMYRGRPGTKKSGKKAYIYLKKGDSIAI